MLGKLLKYEFRATGRSMLPVLGVMTLLVALANVSVRVLDKNIGGFLAVLFGLIIFATVIAVIAAEIMPIVVMVTRFYRNLLGGEGYLMHTLPASVHSLVWSKLIVSCVWMLLTNLVIFLLGGLSALHLGDLSLGQIMAGFPSSAEIRAALEQMGVGGGDVTLLLVEMALIVVLVQLAACLHFYAAMSLGHMFTRHKGLFSVLFFLGFSYLFSAIFSSFGVSQLSNEVFGTVETALDSIRLAQFILGESIGATLIQGVVFYIATVLGLKKGLNLA